MDISMDDDTWDENVDFDVRGTSAYLMLIDASKPMWIERDGVAAAPILIALDACLEMLRVAMITAPKQLFGVSIYNVKQKDSNDQNILEVMKLKEPTVEDVKELEQIKGQLRLRWGASDKSSILDSLRHSIKAFNSCSKRMRVKCVNLISVLEDAPPEALQDAVLESASDLGGIAKMNLISIGIEPIHEFYVNLMAANYHCKLDQVNLLQPVSQIEEILPLLWQQYHNANASAVITFRIGDGVTAGVGIYRLCRAKEPLKKVTLERASNDVVIRTTTNEVIVAPDDKKRTVLRSETCKYQQIGDERVSVTNSEAAHLKKFSGAPSLTLLGFKSSYLLNKERWFLEPCSFLYPNDNLIEGSSQYLSVLRDRCLKRNKVPLCILTPRWYCNPKLVALIPTQRSENPQANTNIPDGFHIVYLPYEENVRSLSVEATEDQETEEQIECMKQILKKLKFKLAKGHFENPKLQKQYAAVEALAFERPEERNVVDQTKPDLDCQQERIEQLQLNFEDFFGVISDAKPEKVKMEKVTKIVEPPDMQMLVSRIQNKTIDKYSVPLLKDIIKWKQPVKTPALNGLKKAQLVEIVYDLCADL